MTSDKQLIKLESSVSLLVLFLFIIMFFSNHSKSASALTDNIEILNPSYKNNSEIYSLDSVLVKSCVDADLKFNCDLEKFTDYEKISWENSCSLYVLNLENVKCSKVNVRNENKNNILDITYVPSFPSYLVTQQNADGSFGNEIQTAKALSVLSYREDEFLESIEKGLTWLKDNRDPKDKCWPKSLCSVSTTAQVTGYLNIGNFSSTNRIIYDARVWLEERQNFLENTDWTLKMESSDVAGCNLTVGTAKSSYTFADDEIKNVGVTAKNGLLLNSTCNESIEFTILDGDDASLYSETDDDLNYKIPAGCWHQTKWGSCNLMTTIFSLMSGVEKDHEKAGRDYLESALVKEASRGEHLPSQDDKLINSLYNYFVEDNEEVIKWLIFKQSNSGAWEDSSAVDEISQTSWALKALLNSSHDVPKDSIVDSRKYLAEKFIFRETVLDLDPLSVLSLYLINYPKISVFQTSPKIINIAKEEVILEIINTNIIDQDITINLSNSSSEVLSFEENVSVPGLGKKNITFKPKSSKKDGKYFDLIKIYNSKGNLTKSVPIVINLKPWIKLGIPEAIQTFKDNNFFFVDVDKSSSNFNCEFKFFHDEGSADESFSITKDGKIKILIDNKVISKKEILGSYSCLPTSNELFNVSEFEFSESFKIENENVEGYLFTLESEEIMLDKNNLGKVTIKNNLDRNIIIRPEVEDLDSEFYNYEIDEIWHLSPKENKEFVFEIIEIPIEVPDQAPLEDGEEPPEVPEVIVPPIKGTVVLSYNNYQTKFSFIGHEVNLILDILKKSIPVVVLIALLLYGYKLYREGRLTKDELNRMLEKIKNFKPSVGKKSKESKGNKKESKSSKANEKNTGSGDTNQQENNQGSQENSNSDSQSQNSEGSGSSSTASSSGAGGEKEQDSKNSANKEGNVLTNDESFSSGSSSGVVSQNIEEEAQLAEILYGLNEILGKDKSSFIEELKSVGFNQSEIELALKGVNQDFGEDKSKKQE